MSSAKRKTFCGSPEHTLSRRAFLGAAAGVAAAPIAADMTQLDVLQESALAGELKKRQKHCILLWLAGGASQLETWDPKPGVETGGPFDKIKTNVPGTHISELLPKMSRRMDKTCIIRSLNTRDGGHGGGAQLMMRGRKDEPNLVYPDLGAVLAKELGRADSKVPDYVEFYSQTEGRSSARLTPGFLGARYAPVKLYEQMSPPNMSLPKSVDADDHAARAHLRDFMSRRFAAGRKSSALESHADAYARITGLMSSRDLFDIEKESKQARLRYGPSQFGQQALMARRMVEAGVPFVRVSRAWWDSHGQNFETHLELVSELDHVMSTLLDDLDERGLLKHTLVITLGEFGRTPRINASLGRDHFATAWSCSLSGCGIVGGAVYGKTDAKGEKVVDGEIGAGELFATIYEALGIKHDKEYHVGSRPIPLVNPGIKPVRDVLT